MLDERDDSAHAQLDALEDSAVTVAGLVIEVHQLQLALQTRDLRPADDDAESVHQFVRSDHREDCLQ